MAVLVPLRLNVREFSVLPDSKTWLIMSTGFSCTYKTEDTYIKAHTET